MSSAERGLPRALVMMATYNGECWIREQVETIMAQTGVEVTLRVADDRSTDSTFRVLTELADQGLPIVCTRNDRTLGVAENFMQLVYERDAQGFDLYAFADQDDLWEPGKLAYAFETLSREIGPTLYYSDIMNFSEDGAHPDIVRYRGCEAYPATVLVRNYVNGCAMVWNDELQQVCRTYRPKTWPRIHDVWMHMVGRFCGHVVADFEHAFVRRRLTGHNVIGEVPTNVRRPSEIIGLIRLALPPYEQAASKTARLFARGYHDLLNEDGRRLLPVFASYATTIRGRIRMARSKELWLPTAQMRLRLRVGLLLGFY